MDNSKSGLFILHDLVSTFPYLVTLIAWAGIACGVAFYALSYKHFNDLIRTSVGVKQDEHHLKKAISYTVFGILKSLLAHSDLIMVMITLIIIKVIYSKIQQECRMY